MKAWHDGIIVDEHSIVVSPLSHSFSRGTAIFEVIEVVESNRGPAIFGLFEHINRLYSSASFLFIPLLDKIKPQELAHAVCETVRANNLSRGIIKIFVYFPVPEYSCIPSDNSISIAIFCSQMPSFYQKEKHSFAARISHYRKNHPECVPIHAKATGYYVNSYLAMMEARMNGFDEAILLDTMGYVAEGSTSNLFIVKNGILLSPTLRSILPGITRKFIFQIAASFMECHETDITINDLFDADEAFFSNSVERIMPICQIDNKIFAVEAPGPLTKKIIEAIGELIEGKNPIFAQWLTFIES